MRRLKPLALKELKIDTYEKFTFTYFNGMRPGIFR